MKSIILIVLLVFARISPAHAGYETNGGDAVCAEFIDIFDKLMDKFSNVILSPLEQNAIEAMIAKRKIVLLSSAPALTLDEVPKDALNYPTMSPPKIEISRSTWGMLTRDQKNQLVMHEMLPVAGFNDKDYAISASLLSRLNNSVLSGLVISRAMSQCQVDQINHITRNDLKIMASFNLPSFALNFTCVPAYEVLAYGQWDFNMCDEKGNTALADVKREAAKYEKLVAGQSDPTGSFEDIKAKYKTVIDLIIRNGGSLKCSGKYQF